MVSNNIIAFPKKKKDHFGDLKPQSLEEIQDNMEMIRQIHIQDTIETVIPMLFDQLTVAGFSSSEEEDNTKNEAMLIESLRSCLSKSYGIFHPLQSISESLFVKNENNILEIPENIHITITIKE